MIGYYKFRQDLDALTELYDELRERFPTIDKYNSGKGIYDLNMKFLRTMPFLRLSTIQAEHELQSIPQKTYERLDECFETLVKLEKEYIRKNRE
jgi:hypothetical protein